MLRRSIRFATLTTLTLLAFAGAASAATPEQIHQDAADGSIDGTYSLTDVRAADRSVSAEQREYYGWEDVYNSWLRSKANPDEVPPAVPVDRNKDGKIDANERAAAKKITRAKCTKATPKAQRSKVCTDAGVDPAVVNDDEAEPRDEDNAATSSKDEDRDGGTSPLLWLIVGIPILVVALGAWRMRRRRKGDPNT